LVNYPQNAATAPTTTANVDGAKVNAFYILNTIHVLLQARRSLLLSLSD
jgi:hypothetical protein